MEKQYVVSADIYQLSRIQEAILDFSEVAKISYINGALHISGNSEAEIQEIFLEFMNYVLSIG